MFTNFKNLSFQSISLILFNTILGIPLFMVSQKPQDFEFLKLFSLIGIQTISFLLLANIFLIPIFISKKYVRVNKFLLLTLTWITNTGFLLPLIESNQMKDATEFDTNYTNLIILSITLIIGFLILKKNQDRILILFLAIFSFASIAPGIPSIMGVLLTSKNNDTYFELSNQKNLIVVSFDAIPTVIVQDILKKNQDKKELFKDFTIFENAIAQNPHTYASIRAELFGNRNYHDLGDSHEKVQKKLNLNHLLINQVDDSFTYGHYSDFKTDKSKTIQPGSLANSKNISEHIYFNQLILGRLFTPSFLKFLDKIKFYKIHTLIMNPWLSLFEKSHHGPGWSTPYLKELEEFQIFTNGLKTVDKDFSVRKAHYLFSHHPIAFDENCEYRGDSKDWMNKNQSYEGAYNLGLCQINLFEKLINKLREIGIYNQSLIILKGDHGSPVHYFEDYPENIKINNHPLEGYNRYRPLLMIKDFNANQNSIKTNRNIVSLSYLANTLAERFKPIVEPDNFPGYNFLSQNYNPIGKTAYLEFVKKDSAVVLFEEYYTNKITITENNFYKILKNIPGIKLSYFNQKEASILNEKRLEDLQSLKIALEKYNEKFNEYPKTESWDAYISLWGKSSPVWIEGLIPEFIDQLPRDPLKSENGSVQYMYKSDGKDYKLISHGVTEDCKFFISKKYPELVDPSRNCWAFGFWTNGARKW